MRGPNGETIEDSTTVPRVITLDFNDPHGDVFTDPYFEDGFRITVFGGHYHLSDLCYFWMLDCDGFFGWDRAGEELFGEPHFRLEYLGGDFSLLSFNVAASTSPGTITSSKGGALEPGLS